MPVLVNYKVMIVVVVIVVVLSYYCCCRSSKWIPTEMSRTEVTLLTVWYRIARIMHFALHNVSKSFFSALWPYLKYVSWKKSLTNTVRKLHSVALSTLVSKTILNINSKCLVYVAESKSNFLSLHRSIRRFKTIYNSS